MIGCKQCNKKHDYGTLSKKGNRIIFTFMEYCPECTEKKDLWEEIGEP